MEDWLSSAREGQQASLEKSWLFIRVLHLLHDRAVQALQEASCLVIPYILSWALFHTPVIAYL